MAIWDDITKKAAALSEKAVKQAKDLSEVAKLKLQIAEAEKTAEDTYAQLGRLYAAAHADYGPLHSGSSFFRYSCGV